MDAHERLKLIDEYGRGYDDLISCLEEIPKDIWQFKPEPVEWSVHEIIIHLADSETNSALRARLLLTQPGNALMAFDENLWANRLDYHRQNWEDALDGVKWARKSTYALLQKVSKESWGNSIIHPALEKPFTFELWLNIYAGHIAEHIKQINNNFSIWKIRNP